MDVLTSLIKIAGQQFVIDAMFAVATGVLGYGLGLLFAKVPESRKVAEGAADYVEWTEQLIRQHTEEAVRAAEAFGIREGRHGIDKMIFALDTVEVSLAAAGIKGDPARVNRARLRQDVQDLVEELFPPKKSA